jgi:hypothetical protein
VVVVVVVAGCAMVEGHGPCHDGGTYVDDDGGEVYYSCNKKLNRRTERK